jgi:GT2 family glycosyltransferase
MVDSVLVAAPTYRGKRYAIVEYIEAFRAYSYPNRDLLLVDNTGDDGAYAAWLEREFNVGVRHIEPALEFEDTFIAAWQVICDYAVEHRYGWVLSLEDDVVGPPLLIDTLLNAAAYVGAPFVTHTYPYHDQKPGFYQGMGCTLMATGLLYEAMKRTKESGLVEGSVYEVAKEMSHISLHGLLPVRHLDPDEGLRQYRPITDPRVLMV